jgi:phosphatidylglycerophosphate synthase
MTKIKKANREAVFSRLFGNNISRAREIVARGMIKLHIGPNTLTVLGLLFTVGAGFFLALGAGDKVGSDSVEGYSWYGFWAGMMLILSCACDMLDGAVARNLNRMTRVGAFLDSCIDRISDGVIFIGILIYYLWHPNMQHSQLLAILSVVALVNALLISYLKARAENFIESCGVGYWQRGERQAAVLIGLFSGQIATVVVMLAVLTAPTVLRRMIFALRQIHRMENQLPLLEPRGKLQGIMKLALWRYPRGTLPYDFVTAVNIAMILFVDLPQMIS